MTNEKWLQEAYLAWLKLHGGYRGEKICKWEEGSKHYNSILRKLKDKREEK